MRRHLQPGLKDPTDKEAIQPLHKYFSPDPLGRNLPPWQNTTKTPETMKQVAILIQKMVLCARPVQECQLENKARVDVELKRK